MTVITPLTSRSANASCRSATREPTDEELSSSCSPTCAPQLTVIPSSTLLRSASARVSWPMRAIDRDGAITRTWSPGSSFGGKTEGGLECARNDARLPLCPVRRSHAPSPPRHGGMFDNGGIGAGVVQGEPRAPLDVGDERGPKLRVVRQPRVIGGQAHQRGKSEPLLVGDAQPAVFAEHPLVATELDCVGRRPAEHLAPPCRDVVAVLLPYPSGEQRREQLVRFDAVVERVDQPPK